MRTSVQGWGQGSHPITCSPLPWHHPPQLTRYPKPETQEHQDGPAASRRLAGGPLPSPNHKGTSVGTVRCIEALPVPQARVLAAADNGRTQSRHHSPSAAFPSFEKGQRGALCLHLLSGLETEWFSSETCTRGLACTHRGSPSVSQIHPVCRATTGHGTRAKSSTKEGKPPSLDPPSPQNPSHQRLSLSHGPCPVSTDPIPGA